jgi:hypothetical protein
MRGAILSLPHYAFMAWCSVKKRAGTNIHSTSKLVAYRYYYYYYYYFILYTYSTVQDII